MKDINFIPELDASDFPDDVEEEMVEQDIGVHYESDGIGIDWDDDDPEYGFPVTKRWLVETYGEEIKKYSSFSIAAT